MEIFTCHARGRMLAVALLLLGFGCYGCGNSPSSAAGGSPDASAESGPMESRDAGDAGDAARAGDARAEAGAITCHELPEGGAAPLEAGAAVDASADGGAAQS